MRKAYHPVNEHLTIPSDIEHVSKVWLVAAISLEKGVDALHLSPGSPNSTNFEQLVTALAKRGSKFIVFGDNASYHNSKHMKEVYRKFKTSFVSNVAYTPELNCIEHYFNILKECYKRLLT